MQDRQHDKLLIHIELINKQPVSVWLNCNKPISSKPGYKGESPLVITADIKATSNKVKGTHFILK